MPLGDLWKKATDLIAFLLPVLTAFWSWKLNFLFQCLIVFSYLILIWTVVIKILLILLWLVSFFFQWNLHSFIFGFFWTFIYLDPPIFCHKFYHLVNYQSPNHLMLPVSLWNSCMVLFLCFTSSWPMLIQPQILVPQVFSLLLCIVVFISFVVMEELPYVITALFNIFFYYDPSPFKFYTSCYFILLCCFFYLFVFTCYICVL